MGMNRRTILGLAAGMAGAGTCVVATPLAAARAGPVSALGVDAADFGVRPGRTSDQSAAVQRAIERTAATGTPLAFAPGVYRVSGLKLPSGAHLVAPRGACRLAFSGGSSLLSAEHAERITLSGLTIDGGKKNLPEKRGLVHLEHVDQLKVSDCEITASGGHGLLFIAVSGEVSGNAITDTTDVALQSFNGNGLLIARNVIQRAGNNGIQLIRWELGDDSTLVVDNRITEVLNRSGGNGQYGNAINAFRGANVIVRGNRIDRCTFSGVRGNSASNIQIVGNTITEAGETAIYSEFSFEGAVIANNIVDGAQTGVSVTNFNEGGRIATVQGNVVRNLSPRPSNPDPEFLHGIGLYVEADTAVTGNVVERATAVGIGVGWGRYLRDVVVSGNVVRDAGIGIGVSVAEGASTALIASNVITGSRRGAIVGMERRLAVTGDLSRDGAASFPNLTITGNRIG